MNKSIKLSLVGGHAIGLLFAVTLFYGFIYILAFSSDAVTVLFISLVSALGSYGREFRLAIFHLP